MIKRRLAILKHWLGGAKNDVSFADIIRNVWRLPSRFLAKQKIKKIKTIGDKVLVYFHHLPAPLYWPHEMDLNSLYQVIVELFYKQEWHYYEIEETRVEADDIVADCGAAEGLFGLSVVERCQKLYLIEPLPRFCDVLKLTFKDYPKVEIIPVGLSEKDGTAFISGNGIGAIVGASGDKQIELRTLDSLFFDKKLPLTYIKADVEGSEMSLLRGAAQTIKENKTKIAITTYHKITDVEDITNFLKKLVPEYKIKLKGIEERAGKPVMLHAWVIK